MQDVVHPRPIVAHRIGLCSAAVIAHSEPCDNRPAKECENMGMYPVLTVLHIGMGSAALVAGAGAMTFRKGSRWHRRAGGLFFVSMLIMSALGANLAFVKPDMGTSLMGAFTFYLVASAWLTVIRRENETGYWEIIVMLVALSLAASALIFGLEASNAATGRKDGYPATFFYVVGGIAACLAVLDLRVIYRRGIGGAQRVIRHLWRMGFALFIAAGSLFLGQPDVFPEALRSIAFRAVPVIVVIGLTIFWLIRVSFTGWYGKQAANSDEPGIRQGIGWRGRAGAARAAGQFAPQSGHAFGPAAD
jgi:hypothetical protein